MANVALKSFMGASALVGSALAVAAHAEPVAQVRYHTVFFKEARQGKQWEDLPIRSSASQNALDLIPAAEGQFAMVELKCNALGRDGGLENCTVHPEPDLDTYRKVGEALRADLKSDRGYAQAMRDNVKMISIQIRLSNSMAPARMGPCWPPMCTYVLAPPPLPSPPSPK